LKKKILLTGARSPITLDLARLLSYSGHEVYASDTSNIHVCRYSNAIKQSFTIPSPRFHPDHFIETLISITQEKKIDFLIPNWEEIFCLSKSIDQFPKYCKIFCSPFDLLNTLHSKWLFSQKLKELGLNVPRTYLISSIQQLQDVPFKDSYILKASYSRAAQRVFKVFPNKPLPGFTILPNNPWIAQEWIRGKKYCCYSVCYNGKVNAHSTYPVEFSIDESSCLTFEAVNHPKILQWVQLLVEKIGYTGQISFDFIESADGKLYAIECNPRATSGLHLFEKKDEIDRSFFNKNQQLITPKVGTRRQIATGMVIYGWRSKHPGKKTSAFLKKLFSIKDVVFDFKDLKPFLLQPYIFFFYCLNCLRLHSSLPATFTYDLDYDNE